MPCRSNGVPYVTDKGAIVIHPGEQFVIAFEIENGRIVSAVPGPASGQPTNTMDVSFKEIDSGMMLTLQSHLPMDVKYDAMMKAPDNRLVYTSSCPVRANLGVYEGWPHTVKFLELSISDSRMVARASERARQRGFLRPLNFGASPGLPALERPRTTPAGPGL